MSSDTQPPAVDVAVLGSAAGARLLVSELIRRGRRAVLLQSDKAFLDTAAARPDTKLQRALPPLDTMPSQLSCAVDPSMQTRAPELMTLMGWREVDLLPESWRDRANSARYTLINILGRFGRNRLLLQPDYSALPEIPSHRYDWLTSLARGEKSGFEITLESRNGQPARLACQQLVLAGSDELSRHQYALLTGRQPPPAAWHRLEFFGLHLGLTDPLAALRLYGKWEIEGQTGRVAIELSEGRVGAKLWVGKQTHDWGFGDRMSDFYRLWSDGRITGPGYGRETGFWEDIKRLGNTGLDVIGGDHPPIPDIPIGLRIILPTDPSASGGINSKAQARAVERSEKQLARVFGAAGLGRLGRRPGKPPQPESATSQSFGSLPPDGVADADNFTAAHAIPGWPGLHVMGPASYTQPPLWNGDLIDMAQALNLARTLTA